MSEPSQRTSFAFPCRYSVPSYLRTRTVMGVPEASTAFIGIRQSRAAVGQCPDLKFSAPPLRSPRLSGECLQANIHRRGAEVAETAQRKIKTEHYTAEGGSCSLS